MLKNNIIVCTSIAEPTPVNRLGLSKTKTQYHIEKIDGKIARPKHNFYIICKIVEIVLIIDISTHDWPMMIMFDLPMFTIVCVANISSGVLHWDSFDEKITRSRTVIHFNTVSPTEFIVNENAVPDM